MNDCGSIQPKFSEYLDGRLTGHEMQTIAAILKAVTVVRSSGQG